MNSGSPAVAVVLQSLSRKGGGIPLIARRLAQENAKSGARLSVFSLEDSFSSADLAEWAPLAAETFPVTTPRGFGYSPELSRSLAAASWDIVHVHGLWTYPGMAAGKLARRFGKPMVITAHGMLDPWALANSRWKKQLAWLAYEHRNLRQACCIHINSEAELEAVRRLGLRNPIAIIPNGVDLPPENVPVPSRTDDSRRLLFLGRIHPKKGIREALLAWSNVVGQARAHGWKFVISGWDQNGHEAELKSLCDALGLMHSSSDRESPPGSIVFAGPAFGDDKEALLRNSDAFILSSFSEGSPMAVLEAWAHRLPVLMTDACNLNQGFQADAAIRISQNAGTAEGELGSGLLKLFSMSPAHLSSMGQNGQDLAARSFLWSTAAAQLLQVYQWALGKASRPAFVHA